MRVRESDLAREVLGAEPGGNGDRRKGRPTLRRCGELGKDVIRVGCRTWSFHVQARERWRWLIEEVSSYRGM